MPAFNSLFVVSYIRFSLAPLNYLLFSFLVLIFYSTFTSAQPRHALVIGNAAYENESELVNTLNDARDMATKLQELGFSVTKVENATRLQLGRAVNRFIQQRQGSNDIALIYYSGHGMQGPGKQNYLVPVDAEINNEMDIPLTGISVDNLLAGLNQRSSNAVNIVILDACRNNPYNTGTKSLGHKGLSKITAAPQGTLILYATKPNDVASDNPTGRNGLFTKHLLSQMSQPGLPVELVFKHVSRKVYQESGQQQYPWLEGGILGDFAFVKKKEVANLEPTPAASPQTPTSGDAYTSQSAEMRFWDEVKDSQNPVYLQAYLDRYPQGAFVLFAKDKLAKLSPASPPTTTSKPDITEQFETVEPALPILTLRSTVSNDEVFIDGQSYGETPLNLPLRTGTYQVRIVKEGYTPFEQKLVLKSDHTLWAKLKKEYMPSQTQESTSNTVSKEKHESRVEESNGMKVVAHVNKQNITKENKETYDAFTYDKREKELSIGEVYVVGVKGKSNAIDVYFNRCRELGKVCRYDPYLLVEGECYKKFCFGGIGRFDSLSTVKWYQSEAEKGNVVAQKKLGLMYRTGREGIPRDDKMAVFWLKKAASQGDEEAQEDLNWICRKSAFCD